MKRSAAILAYLAMNGFARDCRSECGEGESDNEFNRPNLIQDWNDQDSRNCDCKCSFDAPADFIDHEGGRAQTCELPYTYDSEACVCGYIFGSGATTLAAGVLGAIAATLLI